MENRCHGAKTEFHFRQLNPIWLNNNVLSVAVVLHFFGQALSDPSVSNLVRYNKKNCKHSNDFSKPPFFSRSLTLRLILPDI